VSHTAFAVRLGPLVVLSACLLLPAADLAPLERAEIYFLDGARAMIESGDWLIPRYRGEAFFDKPPLTYWLIAGSFEAFGFTLAAARLVPALAAIGTLLACVWLGSLLLDRGRALSGALVLTTTFAFVSFGRIAMSDMLLALWTTLALALAVRLYAGGPSWLGLLLGLTLGLGFLTKGPIALILPGLGIALLAWRERARGLPVSRAWLALSALIFAGLSLSWFAAVAARLGVGPLAYFFLHENIERFAGETYDSGRAPWYYLVTYLAEGAPWSLFLPPALLALRRVQPGADAQRPVSRAGPVFLSQWLLLMLVPLSLSRGKIDYYLLPLYPAASLLIGGYLNAAWSRAERVWGRFALLGAALAFSVAPLLLARFSRGWLPPRTVRPLIVAVAIALVVLCLGAAARFTVARARAVLAVGAALVVLAGTTVFVPAFRRAQPNQAIVDDVSRERRFRPDARLAMCEDPVRVERDLLFWERTTPLLRCDLLNPASSRFPFLLLVPAEQRPAFAAVEGLRYVADYRYLPATALTFEGLVRGAGPSKLVLLANFPSPDLVAEWRVRRDRRRAHWDELESLESGDSGAVEGASPVARPPRDP
jgi:4-amino-4-deoxy-L-arabinose transferase-like glycosyltransferase